MYWDDLAIEMEVNAGVQAGPVCRQLAGITTPLNTIKWSALLENHPDAVVRQYIMHGITEGFHIGFNHRTPLQLARWNMPSTAIHERVIDIHITRELALNNYIELMEVPHADLHINHFGKIPKGHTPGKFLTSFPPGASVSSGINLEMCSLSYVSVDKSVEVVASLSVGTLIWPR